MSSLQAIQQHMLQAVLAEKKPALPNVRSDAIAHADDRLAIYRHGYRIRLRDALKSEFAGLHGMVGRRFDAMLDRYVAAHPSEHYNIRWYGSGLAAFLDYARPWRDQLQLAEMARLDWAISTAFDAADETAIGIADLSQVAPESWVNLRLLLQDNLQIIACSHNIEAFRRAADRGDKRPRLQHVVEPRHILVWRQITTVHYRLLEHDEWHVLRAAMIGETFATLCAQLVEYHDEAAAMPRMVTLLQSWLEAGLVRGWELAQATP